MKTKRIALSAAALILGLAGALVGNSHASAANGSVYFLSVAGAGGEEQWCIGVSSPYAVIKPCNFQADDQAWNQTYEYGTSGYYQFENDAGQCLSVYGGGDSENENIGAGTCNGAHLDQYWALDDVGNNSYRINNYNSGYYITIEYHTLSNGAALVQHSEENSAYQEWIIQT